MEKEIESEWFNSWDVYDGTLLRREGKCTSFDPFFGRDVNQPLVARVQCKQVLVCWRRRTSWNTERESREFSEGG
jgi:hypothetical protein